MKAKTEKLDEKLARGSQLLQHLQDIHSIMEKMGDEQSRVAYRNELITLLLEPELAQAFGFTMSFENWENQLKSINPAEYPRIEYPDENVPQEATGSTFVYPQYEYGDRICLREGDVFLDCGSCAGDVAIWARSRVGETGRVYAFEPSPSPAFELLQRNLEKYAPDVSAFNCAIGEKNGTVKFSTEGINASHHVDPNASLSVPVKSIDDFCEEFGVKPSLIKMDIEGYEPEGLQGAAKTIKKYRPDLSICVYHQPSHMWEIGNLIRNLCPEYTFYFKKHHPVWEAVLYATVR